MTSARPVARAMPGIGPPTGTAVALLHGLCSTHDELVAVSTGLRTAGHAVHALEVPGYAFDPEVTRQRASRYQDWIDEVGRQVGALRWGHDRVVLVGLSAGATLALASTLAGRAVVDGLVLMSITLRLDGWAVPRHQWLLPLALYTPLGRLWRYRERAPYGVKDERVRAWVERQMQERRRSAAGASVLEVSHLRENHRLARFVRRRLGATVCPPVLALHARDDEVASPRNVELLAHRLRCASLRVVTLDNSYHMIPIDHDRRRVVDETLRFVDGIDRPAVAAVPAPTPASAVSVQRAALC